MDEPTCWAPLEYPEPTGERVLSARAGSDPSIELLAQLRLKHAGLMRAAIKVGSVTELARVLGVERATLYHWCNLRSLPPDKPNRFWPADRLQRLSDTLQRLTGQSMEELFPAELREFCSQRRGRSASEAGLLQERTVTLDRRALVRLGGDYSQLALPATADVVAEQDEREWQLRQLKRKLNKLSRRERTIIELRYGLGDKDSGEEMPFKDIAKLFKRTVSRIRQIHDQAFYKLTGRYPTELRDMLYRKQTYRDDYDDE